MNDPGRMSPLVLVPTELEARYLFDAFRLNAEIVNGSLCGLPVSCGILGVGPIAAAAMTRHLLELQPDADPVLLVGAAGTLKPDRLAVGKALLADRVICDGVGFGQGKAHRPLPFPQLPAAVDRAAIHHEISLAREGEANAELPTGSLLTVTCASADPEEARQRAERHPDALAEEMEGFGAALAARLCHRRIAIVRGISNVAGERDRERWDLAGALRAARELALLLLSRSPVERSG